MHRFRILQIMYNVNVVHCHHSEKSQDYKYHSTVTYLTSVIHSCKSDILSKTLTGTLFPIILNGTNYNALCQPKIPNNFLRHK